MTLAHVIRRHTRELERIQKARTRTCAHQALQSAFTHSPKRSSREPTVTQSWKLQRYVLLCTQAIENSPNPELGHLCVTDAKVHYMRTDLVAVKIGSPDVSLLSSSAPRAGCLDLHFLAGRESMEGDGSHRASLLSRASGDPLPYSNSSARGVGDPPEKEGLHRRQHCCQDRAPLG